MSRNTPGRWMPEAILLAVTLFIIGNEPERS